MGIVLNILISIAWGYVIYLAITYADRRKERIAFSLRILKFGLDNGLEDKKIVEALYEGRRRAKRGFHQVSNKLAEGDSLVDALRINTKVFPRSTTSLLEAGEKMGSLRSMVSYAEESINLDGMIRTRMNMQFVYPLLVLAALLPIMPCLQIFIWPTFVEMLHDMTLGIENPVRVSLPFFRSYAVIAAAVLFWLVSYIYFCRSLSLKKSHLTFVRVLSSALSADVEEKVGLELAIQSAGATQGMKKRYQKARNMLNEGFGIDEAIAQSFTHGEELSWFFEQVRRTDAGETLRMWSGILKEKLNRRADLSSQIISTLLILCVGVCVWFITTSVFSILISISNVLMW